MKDYFDSNFTSSLMSESNLEPWVGSSNKPNSMLPQLFGGQNWHFQGKLIFKKLFFEHEFKAQSHLHFSVWLKVGKICELVIS